MQGATKCAVKGAHFVVGDKLCRGDKMCRNTPLKSNPGEGIVAFKLRPILFIMNKICLNQNLSYLHIFDFRGK